MGNKSLICAVIFLLSLVIAFFYQKFTKSPIIIQSITEPFLVLPEDTPIQTLLLDDRFQIKRLHYDQYAIGQLRNEITKTLTSLQPFDGQQFGVDTKNLIKFVEYWHDSYLPKWHEREQLINSLPHVVTNIHGHDIYFIYSKPNDKIVKNKIVIPVLLLHGWPGSTRQYYKFIRMLTNDDYDDDDANEYVFEVIAPCLPGYGWSQSHIIRSMNKSNINFYDSAHVTNVAIALHELMHQIGHKQFVIQCGDWGSIIGATMTKLFSDNIIAYHSTMCVSITPLSTIKWMVSDFWTMVKDSVQTKKLEFDENKNIFSINSTKSVGVESNLLVNSVNLVSNILETIIQHYPNYSYDALLDNIMIYCLTNSNSESLKFDGNSLIHHHYKHHELLARLPTIVPVGCARFCHELPLTHKFIWKLKDRLTNLMKNTWYLDGDHFDTWDTSVNLLYNNFVMFIEKVYHNKNKDILHTA